MEIEAFIYKGWHIGRMEETGRRFWATRDPYDSWAQRKEFCSREDAMDHVDRVMDHKSAPADDGTAVGYGFR